MASSGGPSATKKTDWTLSVKWHLEGTQKICCKWAGKKCVYEAEFDVYLAIGRYHNSSTGAVVYKPLVTLVPKLPNGKSGPEPKDQSGIKRKPKGGKKTKGKGVKKPKGKK